MEEVTHVPCMYFYHGARRGGLYDGSRSARLFGSEDPVVATIAGAHRAVPLAGRPGYLIACPKRARLRRAVLADEIHVLWHGAGAVGDDRADLEHAPA